jgi:2-phosphosulfolactate phosphatase
VKIPGFDLGNSPQEYVPATVCNKTIAFTTTNGTKALLRCQSASRVLIGSFVNLSSLCGSLSDSHQTELVCAGTDNEITFEDVLFAGAVTEKLRQAWPEIRLNDQAAMAAELWRHTESQESNGLRLVDWLRLSRGGRNLVELGFEGDIRFAAEVDKYNLVPCVEMAGLRITADRKLDP